MSALTIIETYWETDGFSRNVYQVPEGAMIYIKESQLHVILPDGHKERYPDLDNRYFKVGALNSVEIRDHGNLIFTTNETHTNIIPAKG